MNHSYNDPINGHILKVTEFRGADAVNGKIEPILHMDPSADAKYDIGPTSFTGQIN